MRKTSTYKLVSLAVLLALFAGTISSCTGNKKEKKSDPKVVEEAIKEEIEEYSYPIVSAFEVTSMLNEIEASYIVGITNDAEKAGSYFSEKDRAVNLGIYTADLAYATTYNQKVDVQSYFAATETLVRELDLTGAFDEELPEKIEANLDDKDALVEIITEMFQNAYSYLNQQGRTEVSYLVLSGTVIEGLYLTTHISENTFQNPKLIEAILFQKEPLMKLESMMAEYKDSELLKDVYVDIVEINEIYAMEEGTTSMTKDQVEKLTDLLTKMRNKFTR
ncbi:hypothetical protein ACRTDU_00290 [Sunxiuqinia elliptica]|uniref:Lipoprotein n=1 Tax=Sunxiuqinia elliptica TaxID=655355 RepID=A0A1I2IK20_9BACT|nr:hypothetical protein [Sunxiuqinia elliptica]SFF42030.1 hypothetical protein SAMN05216283_10661 [Sunxiuqinia elliptica]